MRVYISIPISGRPLCEARQEADAVKIALSKQGHKPVSPFDIYAGKNPSYDDNICFDLRAMLDCEAVYFAPGWEKSIGCNIERDVLMRINQRRSLMNENTIKIIN